jgi:transcriptional regulator with XRE-family HTH domain
MKNIRKKPGPKNGIKLALVKRTSFGERLFRITRTKKVTLKELGEKVGISKRMVTYYETNDVGPPLEILKRMASALDITLAYLVDESPLKIPRDDDVSPTVRKHIETLKKLPLQEQKPIFHMIELAARNASIHSNHSATEIGSDI